MTTILSMITSIMKMNARKMALEFAQLQILSDEKQYLFIKKSKKKRSSSSRKIKSKSKKRRRF